MIDRAKIQKIRDTQKESARLLTVLDFYGWLEDHGLSWNMIKGIRPLDNTPRSISEFKSTCRSHGLMEVWERYNHALFVLKDGPFGGIRWRKVDSSYEGDEPQERRPCAYRDKFIDFKLTDGTQLVLPWPPFPENVIYNKKGG